MDSQADKTENIYSALRLVEQAADRGAQLIGLPEVFNFLGPGKLAGEMAEEIPGPTVEQFQTAARRYSIHLLAGSILEINPEAPTRPFNTSCLIGPDGDILAKYRKMHLFDVDLPGEFVYRESDERTPGMDAVVAATSMGNIGLSICYDVRFPELYRRMSEQGLEILFVPAAFTMQTGRDHWHVLLRARAIENQVYVIAPAQTGKKIEGLVCYGRSVIINPWGTVLAQADDAEVAILTEITNDGLQSVRGKLPCLERRRIGEVTHDVDRDYFRQP